MHWLKRGLFQAAIIVTGTILFLLLATSIPISLAHAQEVIWAAATPGAPTIQATPTIDATVTALNKELLEHENDWWWNYGATILTSVISTLTLAAAGVFTVVRYFNDSRDAREKQEEEANWCYGTCCLLQAICTITPINHFSAKRLRTKISPGPRSAGIRLRANEIRLAGSSASQ